MSGVTRIFRKHEPLLYFFAVSLTVCFWTFYLLRIVIFKNELPFEDSAILFRYADNISEGYGYVYNKSGPWVDGATDIIFTFLLASIGFLGLSALNSYSFVLSLSLILLVVIPTISLNKRMPSQDSWRQAMILFSLFTAIIAMSPALIYNFAGFGTIFHTLLIFSSCHLIISHIASKHKSKWWVIEGAIFVVIVNRIESIFLLFLLFFLLKLNNYLTLKLSFILSVLVVINFIFLCFIRILTIGYPLPNAFYVKGQGKLHFEALTQSFIGVVLSSSLILLLGLVLFIFDKLSITSLFQLTIGLSILSLLWMAVWLLVSNEMNMAQRFQFPIFGLLLAFVINMKYISSEKYFSEFNPHIRRLFMVSIVIIALALTSNNFRRTSSFFQVMDGSFAKSIHGSIGRALNESIPNIEKLTIATTEAGLVPFITKAKTIDLRGLNDKFISHHGPLTSKQLEFIQADIYFLHLNWPRSSMGYVESDWDVMNREALCFLKGSNFQLLTLWSNNLYYDQNHSNAWAIFAKNDIAFAGLQKNLETFFNDLSLTHSLIDFSSIGANWKPYVVNC